MFQVRQITDMSRGSSSFMKSDVKYFPSSFTQLLCKTENGSLLTETYLTILHTEIPVAAFIPLMLRGSNRNQIWPVCSEQLGYN